MLRNEPLTLQQFLPNPDYDPRILLAMAKSIVEQYEKNNTLVELRMETISVNLNNPPIVTLQINPAQKNSLQKQTELLDLLRNILSCNVLIWNNISFNNNPTLKEDVFLRAIKNSFVGYEATINAEERRTQYKKQVEQRIRDHHQRFLFGNQNQNKEENEENDDKNDTFSIAATTEENDEFTRSISTTTLLNTKRASLSSTYSLLSHQEDEKIAALQQQIEALQQTVSQQQQLIKVLRANNQANTQMTDTEWSILLSKFRIALQQDEDLAFLQKTAWKIAFVS
ncbi:MAG: hypothetical protein ACD_45C00180G0012 [uncultured bacterium]|nr:MAG: hypothetical protein ACD_45C00180G0012 [uncultured bacterium]